MGKTIRRPARLRPIHFVFARIFLSAVIGGAVLVISFAGKLARADDDPTAEQLLHDYDTQPDYPKAIIRTAIQNFYLGVSYQQGWDAQMAKSQPLFCTPDTMPVTTDLLAENLRSYIKRNPKAASDPWRVALIVSLADTFPCKPNK